MPTPIPVYPSDATISALEGTLDAATGLQYLAPGISPSSTPPADIQWTRDRQRLARILDALVGGRVVDEGSLKVGVYALEYTLAATIKTFAGATAQAVTDNDTNYIYVDSSNALVINITGFPADLTTFVPLATVVAASGALTITDNRSRTFLTVSGAVGSFANDSLGNLASVAINTSLISDTDDTDNLGSTSIAWQNLFLGGALIWSGASRAFSTSLAVAVPTANRVVNLPDFGADDTLVALAATQTLTNKTLTGAQIESAAGLVFKQATADATVKAADQAAARIYTIPDVAADGDFVMTVGTQTLAAKTLETPTIADLTNMTHTHADAVGGGTLVNTSHGTGKYSPVSFTAYLSGAMTVKTFEIEITAPFDFTIRDVRGRAKTAPTGSTLVMDTNVNGLSIHANQADMVVIPDGGNGALSATENHAVTKGDIITIECEQIGSSVAGSDVTMTINGLAALDTQ